MLNEFSFSFSFCSYIKREKPEIFLLKFRMAYALTCWPIFFVYYLLAKERKRGEKTKKSLTLGIQTNIISNVKNQKSFHENRWIETISQGIWLDMLADILVYFSLLAKERKRGKMKKSLLASMKDAMGTILRMRSTITSLDLQGN